MTEYPDLEDTHKDHWPQLLASYKTTRKHSKMGEFARTSGCHLVQLRFQQGHPEQGAQGHVQVTLEDPQEGYSSASGEPVPLLQCLREAFPVFKGKFLCSSLCLWSLVLALGTTGQSLTPFACLLPIPLFLGIYGHWDHPEPSLLQAEESHLSQPLLIWESLQSLQHICGPLLDSLQYIHATLGTWEAQNWTQYSKCGLTTLSRGRIISLHLLVILCPGIPLAYLATRAYYWLMFNLVSKRTYNYIGDNYY